MSFFSWLRSKKDQKDDINAANVLQKSENNATIASSDLSDPSDNHSSVLTEQTDPQILVVGGEYFSQNLVEYALKMGKRLDCQIIAVSTTTLPPSLSERELKQTNEIFSSNARKAGAKFSELADSIGVSLTHCIEIGEKEQIIHDVAARNPGVRYLLTEPKQQDSDDPDASHIPVFDLASTRI